MTSQFPATRIVLTLVTDKINDPDSGFEFLEGDVDYETGNFKLTALVEWRHPDRMDQLCDKARALQISMGRLLRNTGLHFRMAVMGQEL